MPSSANLIIKGFGLENIKTQLYAKGFGEALPVSATDFGTYESNEERPLNASGGFAYTSVFGTPVFCDAELKLRNKSIFLTTVLMTVSQQRNIVTTAIQGRNGTIKEYINEGDYSIDFKGAIVSRNSNEYPELEVRDFLELLQAQEALDVVSDFLRLFDINKLVISNYEFPQQEGYQNMQLFSVSALSDTDELLIENA